MNVVFYLNIVSPHQLPLAKAVAQLIGKENFVYIYTDDLYADRANLGWCDAVGDIRVEHLSDKNRHLLENADIVYTGLRCLELIERRSALGRKTLYTSERWFKPPIGILRMLVPSYHKMARRFVRLSKLHPNFRILPIGVHALKDFRHMGVPVSKMTTWGYFVAPSNAQPSTGNQQPAPQELRVLWVGRMIHWKRVDTIVRAIKALKASRFTLTLVGTGDEKPMLKRLAGSATNIAFKKQLPIEQIRDEMNLHDVYVLSSNSEEGWGAALNEAMEEGMYVLGTYEAGSSETMLPKSHKFHAGNWRHLSQLLQEISDGKLQRISIGDWTAKSAAERLLAL